MWIHYREDAMDLRSQSLKSLKMLRLLKLLRVFRILRIVRFVQELNNVLYLIAGSLVSFLWTFFLMLLLIYMMSVFLTQLVADYGTENTSGANLDTLQLHFGSLGDAILSTFQAVTGGIDWGNLTLPLMDISPGLSVLFFGYIAFAVLVMLNLVTGVF